MKAKENDHENTWTLCGVLTDEPRTNVTKNNKSVTNIKLSVTTGTGDYVKTTIFKAQGWARMSDQLSTYHKGDTIKVTGNVSFNKWTNQKGETQFDTSCNVQKAEGVLTVPISEFENQADFGIKDDRYQDGEFNDTEQLPF